MPTKNMWMVRAGEGADAIEDFRSKSVIAIGWEEGGDWTQYPNRDAIQARLADVNPENTDTQNLVGARQIERFLRVFRVGDRVITYDPASRKYLAGDIEGDPQYRPGEIGELPLVRAVKWQGEVARDELSLPSRNSLGAISTLFKVPDTAAAEIEAKLAGRSAVPGSCIARRAPRRPGYRHPNSDSGVRSLRKSRSDVRRHP